MRFVLTRHAQAEMLRRHIPETLVNQIAQSPGQIVKEQGDILCYQSISHEEDKSYLIRVMINPTTDPVQIVTVYKTSKIDKYWRMP